MMGTTIEGCRSIVIARADGLFVAKPTRLFPLEISKIDRLISIVIETEKNRDRGNFPAESKAKKFDGSLAGAISSKEVFFPYNSKYCSD
jgi:hypothetical protein